MYLSDSYASYLANHQTGDKGQEREASKARLLDGSCVSEMLAPGA